MAVNIQVKIEDEPLRVLLSALNKKMGNMTPVMKTIGEIVRSSVIRNFEQERDPAGAKWKPSVRAMISGGKTLTDRAILRNSLNVRASSNKVSVGTNIVYAAIHQFGGKAGRGRKVSLPARPFLGVRDDDWTEIKASLMDYLTR
jgi:phage virion morphogenesis protein